MIRTIYQYIILFFIYSFLGWLLEVIATLYKEHKFVNRGFLIGPLCPVYGHGCIIIIILLRKYYKDPLALFIMAVASCGILEYFTSYIMEKLFKARWWDYSDRKFNIAGRVCLENLILFGLWGLLIMYLINPLFITVLHKIPLNILKIIDIILVCSYLIDITITFNIINTFKKTAVAVRKDSTEEITRMIRKTLEKRNILYRRLISSFDFKPSEKLIKEIKEKIEEANKKGKETREKIKKQAYKIKNKIKSIQDSDENEKE